MIEDRNLHLRYEAAFWRSWRSLLAWLLFKLASQEGEQGGGIIFNTLAVLITRMFPVTITQEQLHHFICLEILV